MSITDDLPGTPVEVNLVCPGCGWKFKLGLRKIAEIEEQVEDANVEDAVTCCSQCLANIAFTTPDGEKGDATNARVLEPSDVARMPAKARSAVHLGQFLAWPAHQEAQKEYKQRTGPVQ